MLGMLAVAALALAAVSSARADVPSYVPYVSAWSLQFGTDKNDVSYGVVADASGNAYSAGRTNGGLYGPAPTTGDDAFLVKYDGSGSQVWGAQLGVSTSTDNAYGVALDGGGGVYIAGNTYGTLFVDPTYGSQDAFVAKYNTSPGALDWGRQFGTASADYGRGVSVGGSNVFVAGYDTGTKDMNLTTYDTSGVAQWARVFGGGTGNDGAYGVATDSGGNAIVAGYTTAGAYDNDVSMVKYDSSGTQLWTRQVGATGTSAGENGQGVAVDADDNIFVCGDTNSDYGGAGHGS